REGSEPERLHLDRLADPRCYDPVAHLGLHPGERYPRLAGRQKTVLVEPDPVTGAVRVAVHDGPDGVLEPSGLRNLRLGTARSRGAQKLAYRDHEPERRVHRVVLGGLAALGETVREHPLRKAPGPLEEDGAGLIEPARREAQAAERYEGVAPPVGEPWISGDDGPPFATAHEVGIRDRKSVV